LEGIVAVSGITRDDKINAGLVVALRLGQRFWQIGEIARETRSGKEGRFATMGVKRGGFIGTLAAEKEGVEAGEVYGFLRKAGCDMM